MGFSAMLADEYVLIVPFAYRLHIGLTESISTVYLNFNFGNSIGLQFQADVTRNTSTVGSPDVMGYIK